MIVSDIEFKNHPRERRANSPTRNAGCAFRTTLPRLQCSKVATKPHFTVHLWLRAFLWPQVVPIYC
jgi:hypothetical protein